MIYINSIKQIMQSKSSYKLIENEFFKYKSLEYYIFNADYQAVRLLYIYFQPSTLSMGNQQTFNDSSIIRTKNNQEWTIFDNHQIHQIWQNKITRKRYMAYLIDNSHLKSDQQKQLYHFRKLNAQFLVSIECIVKENDSFLCNQARENYVLVENIPYRLNSFNRVFQFREAVIILKAAMSAYRLLNSIYGPLFTSERMIGFNEAGQTKIWINDVFSSNEPSRVASGTITFPSSVKSIENIEERTKLCLNRLFETVESFSIQQFPFNFKEEARQIYTFQEGQQFMNRVCRNMGIGQNEVICLENTHRNNVTSLPMVENNEDFKRQRTVSETNRSGSFNQIYSARKPNINISFTNISTNTDRRLDHSPNIVRIQRRISFNIAKSLAAPSSNIEQRIVQQINVHRPAVHNRKHTSSLTLLEPISTAQTYQNNNQTDTPVFTTEHIQFKEEKQQRPTQQHEQEENQYINQKFTTSPQLDSKAVNKQIINEQVLKLLISPIQSEKNVPQNYQITLKNLNEFDEARKNSDLQCQVQIEQQSQSNQHDQSHDQSSQNHQQSYHKTESHEQSQSEQPYFNQRPSVKQKFMTQEREDSAGQQTDQMKNWQQSLSRFYKKKQIAQNFSSQERYLSEERDKVQIQQNYTKEASNDNTIQDLESYIRKKYNSYLGQNRHLSQENSDSYHITSYEDSSLKNHIKIMEYEGQLENNGYASKYREQPSYSSKRQLSYKYEDKYRQRQGSIEQILSSEENIGLSNEYRNQIRKYTFGKVQLDPYQADIQYNSARLKTKSLYSNFQKRSLKGVNSNFQQSFQEKYSKYVTNKTTRVPKLGLLNNKDISSIIKCDQSAKGTKREFILNDFIAQNNPIEKSSFGLETYRQNEEIKKVQKVKESHDSVNKSTKWYQVPKGHLTYEDLTQFLRA